MDATTGLSGAEAARRLEKFGPNRIAPRRRVPVWLKFLQEFNQPLLYILLLASRVTALLGESVDSSVIFAVIFINGVVGFVQEARAEKAIAALARMVVAEVTVPRDGVRQRLDESALTGESLTVAKHCNALALDTVLADRKNLAFAGTLVSTGQAEGVAWATGDETQIGHIARLVAEAVELSTPLTKKLRQLSRLLIWVILCLAAATFIIGLARGERAVEMFMAAVALAVAAIPEGLPAAVTIVLAIGVGRMARRRAIIRHLPAVETLGSTTVICSDKTGTLTENEMTVREIFAGGRFYDASGAGYGPQGGVRSGIAGVNVADPSCTGAMSACRGALQRRAAPSW